MSTALHVLRVFCAEDGTGGNPLGVFLDGASVPEEHRQAVAAELGFSETVFVDDPDSGRLQIFTPSVELPLAGHPLVGAAWLLERERAEVDTLRPTAGEVPTWSEGESTWIRARAEWAPPIELVEMGTPEEVEGLDGPPVEGDEVDAWAWLDRDRGLVRSRVFVPGLGIFEDEATGAAALRLVAHLGRPIEIRQGKGSVLLARPGPDGTSEIGGRVVLDDVREETIG